MFLVLVFDLYGLIFLVCFWLMIITHFNYLFGLNLLPKPIKLPKRDCVYRFKCAVGARTKLMRPLPTHWLWDVAYFWLLDVQHSFLLILENETVGFGLFRCLSLFLFLLVYKEQNKVCLSENKIISLGGCKNQVKGHLYDDWMINSDLT